MNHELLHVQSNNDFDLKDIVRSIKDQAKDAGNLSERIKALEDKIGTHEKIAETLSVTAEKAVQMQTMLTNGFIKLLHTSPDVKAIINSLINNADRDYVKKALKRFGFLIYSAFVFILGGTASAAITVLVNHFVK